MNKAAQAAAMERLRHLLTVFNDLRSPGQLTDAMTELGCIYAELMQTQLVPRDEMLRELAETGRQNTGSSRTQAIADHSYLMLCIQAAGMYSKRQRLLLRPAPEIQVPQWTIRTSTQAADQAEPTVTTEALPNTCSVLVTKWEQDYIEQGQRYAFFVSELLVNLQSVETSIAAAASDPMQASTNQKPRTRKTSTKPKTHANKLRHKIQNSHYVYPGSYKQLVQQIGGSVGTWTNIFKNPENEDLLQWKDNKGVYARNCQAAAQQVLYEDEEYLPDDEVEQLIDEEIKRLPKAQQQQAREQFSKLDGDTKRKTIQMLSRS